jgi:hypothetical protein
MSNQAEAIQAIAAALAAVMLPDGAVVLDPGALAAALSDWHARRDRLAEDEAWCQDWPGNLDLRDAVLDLLLVYEDEIVYRRYNARAEAAGDQQDARDWRKAIARCDELRRALADRIATLLIED